MRTTLVGLTLVVVGGASVAAGVARSVTQQVVQQAYPETSTRGNARIFYWGGNSSAGQLVIDYGTPVWKDAYDQQFENLRRWRFGQNFWTNLDTNIDLVIGSAEVLAGYYYLALERQAGQDFELIILDPEEVRDAKLDSFHAHLTEGGIRVPLKHETVDSAVNKLTVNLKVVAGKQDRALLEILFGKHRMTVPVEMRP